MSPEALAREDDHGLLERSLALFPGLQIGPSAPEPHIVRRDIFGALATAQGAAVGETELDVMAWLTALWVRGEHAAGHVEFSLYRIVSELHDGEVGGSDYARVARAIDNLHAVQITLSAYDAQSGRFEKGAFSRVHILETVVIRPELHQLQLLSEVEGEELTSQDVGQVGGVRGTYKVSFAPWLIRQLEQGVVIRYPWEVQRRLRGHAKRVWLFLQAIDVFVIQDGLELATIDLDERVYGALNIMCARERDSRRQLAAALKRIMPVDRRYVTLAVEAVDGAWKLCVERRATAAWSDDGLRPAA